MTGTLRGSAGLSLEKAGKGTLVFYGISDAVYRNRRGRVRVHITYGAFGGTRTKTTSTAFEIVRTKLVPEPTSRITGLRAVRRGNTVRVTWRTSRRISGGSLAQVVGRPRGRGSPSRWCTPTRAGPDARSR